MNFKDFVSQLSLRKINSLIVLIIVLLLAHHAILSGLYMWGLVPYSPSLKTTGRRLFLWALLHIIISLYLYLRDRFNQRNYNVYSNIRNDTLKQIVTGVAVLLSVSLHVYTYHVHSASIIIGGVNLVHLITDAFLFVSVLTHLQISIPRLMVSFGYLQEEDSYGKLSKILAIVLSLIFIGLLLGEIIFALSM